MMVGWFFIIRAAQFFFTFPVLLLPFKYGESLNVPFQNWESGGRREKLGKKAIHASCEGRLSLDEIARP